MRICTKDIYIASYEYIRVHILVHFVFNTVSHWGSTLDISQYEYHTSTECIKLNVYIYICIYIYVIICIYSYILYNYFVPVFSVSENTNYKLLFYVYVSVYTFCIHTCYIVRIYAYAHVYVMSMYTHTPVSNGSPTSSTWMRAFRNPASICQTLEAAWEFHIFEALPEEVAKRQFPETFRKIHLLHALVELITKGQGLQVAWQSHELQALVEVEPKCQALQRRR